MKKLFAITTIFSLIIAACADGNTTSNSDDNYKIGDTGPGGGTVFFAEGGQYKECSGELGAYTWDIAMTTASNYRGGGFTNWHLPDSGELDLLYQNLFQKGLGGLLHESYWSSSEYTASSAYFRYFDNTNYQSTNDKTKSYRVRAVRSFTFEAPPKTTFAITNLSDYDLINVEYASVDFGAINSGKDITKGISAGTRYVFFSLPTANGDFRCRTEAAITCEDDKKNTLTITNNTVIITTVDSKTDSLKNIFDILNKTATLKIKNESFTEITDVIWQDITFANNQYENSIKTGTSVTQAVQAGAGYIFFKRKSNPITARTANMVIIEQNEDVEFTFADNTTIVEANNHDNTGTLGALQSTVVWWDDAEGEMQPYSLKQSYVEYYTGSASNTYSTSDSAGTGYYYYHAPRNGAKSIRVGGTNTALLQLKITLTKKARLSFWYANYATGTTGTTFSINSVEKAKWTTDVNWSQFSIELEPGENNLIWAKKDGVNSSSPRYYRYLSLDDILIYYTE